MLTEKEKNELVKIMEGVNNTQNAIFNGHFEAIQIELSYIKDKGDKTFEQAKYTNGRVNKHDVEIALMVNDKKNWRQRLAYNVIVLGIALIASYVTINTASMILKDDIKEAKTEMKTEIKAGNKIQDSKINDNKDAINEQGVENAFQNSLRDDE